jgi:hypothetical protein
MVKYLLKTVNTYRVHTVAEVEQLHEELKHNPLFELTAFSYTTKDIKVKGEVIDQYQVVKAQLVFANEKEPEAQFEVEYHEV